MPFYYNPSLRNWQEENMGMWFICVRFFSKGYSVSQTPCFSFFSWK